MIGCHNVIYDIFLPHQVQRIRILLISIVSSKNTLTVPKVPHSEFKFQKFKGCFKSSFRTSATPCVFSGIDCYLEKNNYAIFVFLLRMLCLCTCCVDQPCLTLLDRSHLWRWKAKHRNAFICWRKHFVTCCAKTRLCGCVWGGMVHHTPFFLPPKHWKKVWFKKDKVTSQSTF